MKLSSLITIKDLLEREVQRADAIIYEFQGAKSNWEKLEATNKKLEFSAALEDLQNHDFH